MTTKKTYSRPEQTAQAEKAQAEKAERASAGRDRFTVRAVRQDGESAGGEFLGTGLSPEDAVDGLMDVVDFETGVVLPLRGGRLADKRAWMMEGAAGMRFRVTLSVERRPPRLASDEERQAMYRDFDSAMRAYVHPVDASKGVHHV